MFRRLFHGQPLFASHPHLLKHNELTPGIPLQDYHQRRKRLLDTLPDDSLVVSVAAPVKYMSNNIFYKYRQASDFWYLSGFEEPESAFTLEKTCCSRGYRMTLFHRGSDPSKEIWDGPRTSLLDSPSLFSLDASLPITSFPSHLRSLSSIYSNVYLDAAVPQRSRTSLKSILQFLSPSTLEHDSILDIVDSSKRRALAPQIARLRAVKSIWEQRVMASAADISGRAHLNTMRFSRPDLSESSVAAHFEYLCALEGSQRMAYVPVVASGSNALTIHYTANNHLLQDGQMVLMDAGCEYNGYSSDITRTYPVSGKFTPPQSSLYTAVLSAQKSLVALCTQSSELTLNDLHRKSCELLKQELKQIGFFAGEAGRGWERNLYPHFLSHPIGIDIHESKDFDRNSLLKEGMVITIEPGIYVPPDPAFPKHFQRMGIRIEDEVLIGKDHPIVLSTSAPKEIVDVENACQGLLGQ